MTKLGHFDNLTRWLDLEAAAEQKQLAERARRQTGPEAERSGNCLVKLVIRDERAAFGGRAMITLAKRDETQSLPWNRFSVGTPVLLTEEKVARQKGWRGVVCRRDYGSLDVVLVDSPEPQEDRPTFRLDFSSDEISRQRQQGALRMAATAERGRLVQLREVLLGERAPRLE